MSSFILQIGNPETSAFDSDAIKSVSIKQTICGMKCTYALAAKGDADNLSACTRFDPSGNGEKLWNDLKKNGKLTESSVDENLKGSTLFINIALDRNGDLNF